ncbi:MAG: hypothetical protein LCH63_15965 [Candidatus Melainabacteria bacterium]|nr:hypothetical protein [Candidatus Melainabacteria bacterium]
MEDQPNAPENKVLLPGGKTIGERLAGPKAVIGSSITINAAAYSFFFAALTMGIALAGAFYPFYYNLLPLLTFFVILAALLALSAGTQIPRLNNYYLTLCEKTGNFELDKETRAARLIAMKITGQLTWLAISLGLFCMLVHPIDLLGIIMFSTIIALNLKGQAIGHKRLMQNLDVAKLQPKNHSETSLEDKPKLEDKKEKPVLKVVTDNTATGETKDAVKDAAKEVATATSPKQATVTPLAIAEQSVEALLMQVRTAKNSQEANALAYKCLLKMKPKKAPKPDGDQVHALVDELIRIKRNNDADKISARYLELLEAD